MKATKIIAVSALSFFFMMIFAFSVNAGKPALTPAEHVQKMIKESIKYPEHAVKECCQGSVEVTFTLDENGKILVEDSFSTNPEIEKYVKEQLSEICCKGITSPYNQHYKITISFKLVG